MMLSRRRSAAVLAACAAVSVATIASLPAAPPAAAASGCVSPPDYAHEVPAPFGGPAVAPSLGNSVYFATLGGDRRTYVVETTIDGPDLQVGPLECMGGGAVDTPAIAEYAAGKAMFVLAPTGRIYESYAPRSAAQTAWTQVPGAPVGGSAPVVTTTEFGGPLEMFVRGRDNRLYHATRALAADATWSGFEALGGALTGIAAAGYGPSAGTVVVVVRAPNGTLWQKAGRTGGWGPWTKLAGTSSASPTLATGFGPGRLDLFVTGSTGGLYQATWSGRATGFGAFKKIATDLPDGSRLAAAGSNGRMIVYVTARFGSLLVAGFDQYVPRAGWSGFQLSPYTCDECLPDGAATALTAHRHVQTRPMR
jgi:hypothetical protein